MTLNTRKPTGLVAYPLILLEGEEKAGKTYAALSLSKSQRVGRTFILELDEPTADEYQSLGDFEIIEHNGTYSSILEQLTEATKVPAQDNKPNVIILDTGSAMWGLLKDWASSRARNSKKGQRLLEQDPDAEIDISMNLWNDAKDRWYAILNLLRKWPGIGIITARGKEVAKVQNGVPVVGQSEWSTEAEKSTPYTVSAVVRMTRPHVATLVACRSLNIDVGGRGLKLEGASPIEEVVFDVLGAGGEFQVSSAVPTSVGRSIAKAKTDLVAIFARAHDEQSARKFALEVWTEAKLDGVQEINEEQWLSLTQAAADKIASDTQGRGGVMALYHGGILGYSEGELLPDGCQATDDIEEAMEAARKHEDGNEQHGGNVYRVRRYGKCLRVAYVVIRNISRDWDREVRI